MLSKYINHLLINNNKVIVPDLGAFIRKEESPANITFNEFLRYNDNLLIDHIVIDEGISKTEATQKLIKMVEDIHLRLGMHKQVELQGLGTLIMDENEKIHLASSVKSIKETKKPEPSVKETPREIVFDEKTEIIDSSSTPAAPSEEKIPEKTDDNGSSADTSPAKLFIIGAIAILTLGVITYFSFFNNSTEEMDLKGSPRKEKSKPQDIINSDSIAKARPQIQAQSQTEKPKDSIAEKKQTTPPAVTSKKEKVSPKTEKPVTKEKDQEKPQTVKAKVAEKKTEKIESQVVKTANAAKAKTIHYHVVAGSFASEANAEKLIKDIKSQGFKAQKIGFIKNKYYVGYASFSDKESAEKEAQRLRTKGKSDVWILTY